MKSSLALGLLLFAMLPASAQEAPQYPQPNKPVRVESEEWSYTMKIKLPGTRSEARTGILAKDGTEIKGKSEGEVLETPYGKLEWRGTEGYLTGWQPHVPKAKAD